MTLIYKPRSGTNPQKSYPAILLLLSILGVPHYSLAKFRRYACPVRFL